MIFSINVEKALKVVVDSISVAFLSPRSFSQCSQATAVNRAKDVPVIINLLPVFLSTADPYVYLDKCTNFDQARLDQRFEVVDEPIVSVCSKFAPSKFYISL